MSSELAKTYDPAAVEAQAYQVWLDEKCFHAEPGAPGEPYTIVIPPPNVTGALHLGHAINNTLQDILIRTHRMRGFNALWVPGIDHAGIATQAVVEKQLKEKENKTRHDLGREKLVERIWQWKEQYGNRIVEQLKRMGCSCDWDRSRFTLDEMCAKAVRETFFKLFKDGLIYRGKRLVNWDVFLQTSVSDDEIYYETVKTSLWHLKYPIVDAPGSAAVPGRSSEDQERARTPALPDHMVVATTRPETMLGDTAVAVHPDDPRWNWAIGKFVKLPLMDRLIPIIGDPILVNMEFGTGCVKVTPAHDPNDYAVWQRQAGKIDLINVITPDGKINENGGKYAGMKRDAARKKIVDDLAGHGLLAKEEPYETQVGHSDRSKTPIEPYLSDQWFVKMAPLAEPALEVVRNGTIKFYPERHGQQYLAWLGEKRDWPISRQLWWGHRIPVWSGEAKLTTDFQPETRGTDSRGFQNWTLKIDNIEVALQERTSEDGRALRYFCVPLGHPEIERWLEERGHVQDPDVLDTWFSSALWPHSTLGWPEQTPELAKYYPTSVLLTGRDIITLWVARMVMMGLYNMGHGQFVANSQEEAQSKISNLKSEILKYIPFHTVAINPTILDGKGERMSKSKGNGVDPVEIIDTHGADAMRFTLTTMATETQDARLPVKKDAQGRNTSDKFDIGRNFCNKIWNAVRFALSNIEGIAPEPVVPKKLSLADRWILSRLARTIDEVNTALATYRFDVYAKTCYDFFWRDLCDWYVEAIKPEFKDADRRGQVANVLATALDASLRLMHPMIPFITETIWWKLADVAADRTLGGLLPSSKAKRLVRADWPKAKENLIDVGVEEIFTRLQEVVAGIRNIRNEYKVDPKKPVSVSIDAPKEVVKQLRANQEMVELLAICTITDIGTCLPTPVNCARAMAAGCELFVENMVDADAQRQRTVKRREELTKQIAAMTGRLSNESYTAKAPPHLVAQTKQQLAEAQAELAKLE